jgi:hypothetical protein
LDQLQRLSGCFTQEDAMCGRLDDHTGIKT